MPESLCPAEEDLLTLASGEPASAELYQHLTACSTCEARLRQLRAELADLRQSLTTTVPAVSPEVTNSYKPEADTHQPVGPSPELPATIGRYRVLSRLAVEGEAEVYRVMHPTIANELVLKLTHRPPADSLPDRDRRLAEARVLAELTHPNLVRVHDLDMHEGRPFLVMEYVRGPHLKQYAETHRPSPRAAAGLVAQAARAVAAAHARGVVHCDLKPKNILIDEAGQPRVIDFGLALRRGAWVEESEPGLSGTPAFMAPEQARGDTERIGPASDVFALGSVLYYLLTGKPPFTGKNVRETLDRAARCDFDRAALRAPGIPSRLAAICLRAMAADPAERYVRADQLAEALERAAHGPEIVSVAVAAALVLLLAAGAAGVWWWLRTPSAAMPSPPPLSGELIVRLWTPGGEGKRGLRVDEPGALPARHREWVQVQADLNQPAYVYLLWLDGQGEVTPLYPWNDEKIERGLEATPPERPPLQTVFSPTGDSAAMKQGWPLDEQNGLETVLLLARRTPLPAKVRLADVLGKLPPVRLRHPLEVAVRGYDEGQSVEAIDWGENRGIAQEVEEIDDPLLQLMGRLQEHFEMVRAVRFAHQGR